MAEKENGYWFTMETGAHVHVEDGETPNEAINRYFGKGKEYQQNTPYKELTKSEETKSIGTEEGLSAEETKQKILSEQEPDDNSLDELLGYEYIGFKGQAAVDKLMHERQGHVKGAFHRDDIGDIDLLWGNDYLGLQHIIKRREEQGIDSKDFVQNLAEVVEKGSFKKKNDRGNFEFWYNGKLAVIAPEYHGNKITYVLTAYKQSKKNYKAPQ